MVGIGGTDLRAEPLKSELEGLLASHPDILARQKSAAAAEEGVRVAYSGYLPKLDIYGETGPQYIDSPVLQSQGGGTWVSIAEVAGARLTQPVFDGSPRPPSCAQLGSTWRPPSSLFKVSARMCCSTALMPTSRYCGRTVWSRWPATVSGRSCVSSISRTNVCSGDRGLPSMSCRRSRGCSLPRNVASASRGLADAVSRYIQVFAHAPDVSGMMEPPPPSELLPDDLESALQTARQQNPAIDSSLATVAVADERKRLARSGYYPTVDVVGRAARENNNDLAGHPHRHLDHAERHLEPIQRLCYAGRCRSGLARAPGGETESRDYQPQGRGSHPARLERMDDGTAARELLENAVAIASEVFEARQKLREAGRETVINVLDAENEVYNARINSTQARGTFR